MNENKKGKKYQFPDSFFLIIGHIRVYFQLPYRQTEGIIKATGKNLPDHPSYGHICKRINKLKVDFISSIKADDDDMIIAIDSTGIKVTNRGQWMSDKWNIKKKKGYLKIHIVVNIKTKEILALDITDEKVHDGNMLKKLVDQVFNIKSNKIKIRSVLADGAHDTNKNFQYLEDKRITPGIKVRKNAIVLSRNNKLRNKEVRLQINDFLFYFYEKVFYYEMHKLFLSYTMHVKNI